SSACSLNYSFKINIFAISIHHLTFTIHNFLLVPTFDIVSKIEIQKLDNAINASSRELSTRYDFHNSKTQVDLDKKEMMIHILTENDMRMKAIEGIIIARMVKQGIEP